MNQVTHQILKSARQRFSDYGPSKTTMAEIAADCGMSVGNLYRHFKNKDAMMVACMEQQLQEKLDAGQTAATEESQALDALRAFLQTRLGMAYTQFSDTRHLFDFIQYIQSKHIRVLLTYEEKVIASMANILKQGLEQGSFTCSNCQQTAYDIHQATLRYNSPIALQNNSLEILTVDLNRLIDLLYTGLSSHT